MRSITLAVCFLGLVALATPGARAVQYRVHNIGDLIRTERNVARAINESNVVVAGSTGYEQTDHQAAYLWRPGSAPSYIQVTGILDIASDINDHGDVVGYGGGCPERLTVRMADGTLVGLDRPPGMEHTFAYTSGINDDRQVVGTIGDYAVFWSSPDSPIEIGDNSARENVGIDLNNSDQVLWSSTSDAPDGLRTQPYIWTQSGGSIPLMIPADAASWGAYACAMNDDGIVVGRANGAVKWLPDGTVQKLPDMGSTSGNEALGVNNVGQVVGSLGKKAVLWNTDGSIVDLSAGLGDYESYATDINDRGWITGYLVTNDWAYCQSLVWEPVPEPSSLLILCSGLLALAGIIRRKK
ncbi:MAG TPA: PEP-CTERM sorting domain-containing protein [Armatimonadota bacterium]|nr:PEP-CTERM sorting domain-containing protein [Armatimonadota bacterium]